jgi:hypothetical protein
MTEKFAEEANAEKLIEKQPKPQKAGSERE